ncbi:hypothetical protein OEZ86_007222 [Tetradesmus obliquus]|nr:hypothetical protein OEZ86_007222 [Tetradesmus obliquus]
MQHTKIINKKLSASLFGKEQGEGSSLNTNGSTACSDDSNGSSDGFQGYQQPSSPCYQPAVGQPTPDSTTQLTKVPAASESSCSPQLQPAKDAAASAASAQQQPPAAQQQQQQRGGVPASGAGRSSFFFARVPPTITQEQLVELFSKYGAVEDLNLFRPFAEAKTSKGCGIVRFSSAAAAATAKSVLHGKFKWTDTAPPMVVEWVNEDKMRSTCCKAGSNEVVLEPKSKTARSKQHSQSSTVQSSTMHSSGGNDSGVSSSSAQHIGDLTLASMLSSSTGHAMDIGSSMGSDQQQQQQQDIVQAVMQAATNSAAQFAAQQQQQQQRQQQQVYVMMMGYAQQQQQMQQQLQQQCQDHAMAMAAGLDPAAQQQVLKQSGSFNAGLSGFCLMDTSSMSGLQQYCMQNNSNVSHPSLALNAAGALGSAADGALDCPVSGSCLPNGPAAFRKQPPPQQQQQQQQQAMHDEEQWMSGCGVGGYFDLQPSSSHNSGSFHAGLGQAGLSAGQAAGPSSAQQHAAVLAGASGGLPNGLFRLLHDGW